MKPLRTILPILPALTLQAAETAAAKNLLDEVRLTDEACDAAVAAIASPEELFAKQAKWRAAWLGATPGRESYTTAVWGALRDYDWPDLVGEAP